MSEALAHDAITLIVGMFLGGTPVYYAMKHHLKIELRRRDIQAERAERLARIGTRYPEAAEEARRAGRSRG